MVECVSALCSVSSARWCKIFPHTFLFVEHFFEIRSTFGSNVNGILFKVFVSMLDSMTARYSQKSEELVNSVRCRIAAKQVGGQNIAEVLC